MIQSAEETLILGFFFTSLSKFSAWPVEEEEEESK
jgi:hypothetical protein